MLSSQLNLEVLFEEQQLGPLVISHLFDHGVSQGLAAVQRLRRSSRMMRAYIDLSRLTSGAHCLGFWFWHQQWMQNKVDLRLFIRSYRHNIVGHWNAGSFYKQNCQGPRLEGGAAGNQEIMMHIYDPYPSGMDNGRFVIQATVTPDDDSAGFLSFQYQDMSYYANRRVSFPPLTIYGPSNAHAASSSKDIIEEHCALPSSAPIVKFFESYIEKHLSCVKVRTDPLTDWVLRKITVGPPPESVPPAPRGVGVGRESARPFASDQLATAMGQVPHAKDKSVDESISCSAKAVHPALKSIYLQAATLRLCDRPASPTDSDTAPLLEQNELLERLLCNTPPEGVPPASAGTSPVTAD